MDSSASASREVRAAMIEAPHYSATGSKQAAIPLPEALFDSTVNEQRGVAGRNQNPCRQKGPGRARQGSIRSPHWRHGGIVFGPRPRDYRLAIPKKIRQLAKKSALNARAREGALLVVDPLAYEKPKT